MPSIASQTTHLFSRPFFKALAKNSSLYTLSQWEVGHVDMNKEPKDVSYESVRLYFWR